jgi:zinc/manganese transport system substrate-binding protein
VLSAVGGNRVDVSSLIDSPSKDPHDYESTAIDATKVSDAQLVLLNGGGYDEFMEKAVGGVGGKRATIDAFSLSGKGKNANEHVFYDLPTVERTADAVAKQLAKIQPAHKAEFDANARKFDQGVDALRQKAAAVGKGKRLNAMATEGVADYLLAAAGVHNATPEAFAQAVEKGQDVPATAIADTQRVLDSKRVRLLIDNVQTDTATINQLRAKAKAAGVGIVPVSETFPAGVHGYLQWMGAEIDGLAKAAKQR